MAGTKGPSGIAANLQNRSFEVALMLALDQDIVFRPKTLAADLGLTTVQAQQVCRQLVAGDIAERVRPGRYVASVGLRRMVALWTPKTEGPSK